MKSIRIVVIIGAVAITGACSFLVLKQNAGLSGTWIGAYYFDPNSGFGSKSSLNWLVEVTDDELKVSTLRIDGVHAPNRFTSIKYRRKGNHIFLYLDNEVDSIAIVSESDDSTVLQYHEEGESKFVFKRFTRGASPILPPLYGKSFQVFAGDYRDSISFITESLFINISPDAVRGKRWAATSVGDYRFLLFGEYGPPLYVKSVRGDTLTLENFGSGRYVSLVMLDDGNLSLEGRWEEVERRHNQDYNPPPSLDNRMQLTFGPDSCEILSGTRMTKRRWRLNSTAEILYFDPVAKPYDRDWAWYVERVGDSLVIDRRILSNDGIYDSSEKIIFIKRE